MARFPSIASLPLFAALIPGLAMVLAGCDRQSAEKAQPQEQTAPQEEGALTGKADTAHAGEPIPDLTVEDPSGAKLSLTSLRGKPVLLNLWATWCAPCVVEMPMLDKLAGDYDGQLRVLTVSQDLNGAEAVAPFFQKQGFAKLEPWLDPKSDLAFHFGGGTVLPTTIFYDADGNEVWRIVGGYDWGSKDARSRIDAALGKPAQ